MFIKSTNRRTECRNVTETVEAFKLSGEKIKDPITNFAVGNVDGVAQE